jgi:hypothetical protein
MHGNDPGALRFKDQKDYAEAARRASDKDFLVLPWEEPSMYFGGHYNIAFPKNVYFSRVRKEGQPFTENDPVYGKVYHIGSSDDVQRMLTAENGYWYTSHPRTKNSAGQPDVYWDKPFAKSDTFLGLDFTQAMGVDLSEKRMSEWRSFDATDTMNNLNATSGLKPKYLIPDIDTYVQGPEDNLYSGYQTAYLKLDRVPGPDEDWTPVLKALRDGDFFVTTGEILIKKDVSARVRRGRLGRRQDDRPSDHFRDRPAGVWQQALLDSVRRDREIVGTICGVGFSRQPGFCQCRLAEPGEAHHQLDVGLTRPGYQPGLEPRWRRTQKAAA